MRSVNPLSATFSRSALSGNGPGSVNGPNDGQDAVQGASVNYGFAQLAGSDAYLAALVLGATNAPPGAQPPAISTSGGVQLNGVKRLSIFTTTGVLKASTGQDRDFGVALDTGIAYYFVLGGTGKTADEVNLLQSTHISSLTSQWAALWFPLRFSGSAPVGPAYGLAALDDGAGASGHPVVPVNQLPINVRYGVPQLDYYGNVGFDQLLTAPLTWNPDFPYALGDRVLGTVSGTDYVFEVSNPGVSDNSPPTWVRTTGATVIDNGVVWTNRGPIATPIPWATGVHNYGHLIYAVAIDTNTYVFECTTSGTSAGSEPAIWTATVGGTTTDGGGVVWTNQGPFVTTRQLAVTVAGVVPIEILPAVTASTGGTEAFKVVETDAGGKIDSSFTPGGGTSAAHNAVTGAVIRIAGEIENDSGTLALTWHTGSGGLSLATSGSPTIDTIEVTFGVDFRPPDTDYNVLLTVQRTDLDAGHAVPFFASLITRSASSFKFCIGTPSEDDAVDLTLFPCFIQFNVIY